MLIRVTVYTLFGMRMFRSSGGPREDCVPAIWAVVLVPT
jgi:hypothetical protein